MAKEETKKAVGLVGAILAVFVCAGWRIVGATKPAPAPAPAAPESTAPASGTPTPEAKSEGEDAPIEVPSIFAMGTSDPFKWLVRPDKGRSLAKAPQGSSLGGSISMGPITPLPRPGQFFSLGQTIPTEKEAVLKLTGVLPGTNAVAVVEVGDASYVVRKGERFGGGYTLDAIGTDRVAILHGAKRMRLVLGE